MKRKVLVGGCFDILHYGHVQFLKKARSLGDFLVVILESDSRVKKLKGLTRPIHNQKQRKEILMSLKFVDEVIILNSEMDDSDYEKVIKKINPQIIAITKGVKTKTHADIVNAKVVQIPKIPSPSSSQIAKIIGLE